MSSTGYYIREQHGNTNECYDDVNTAKTKCMEATDCHGIASQTNVGGGCYRVSHGTTATLAYYSAWTRINMWAYTLNRSCLGGMLS